jgi:magnesium-transporting ATPase (P-type)
MDLIDWESDMKSTVNDHLKLFAISGLRTLVMGKRELTDEEVETIVSNMDEIDGKCGEENGDKLMDEYDKYETDLTFVGASAIEDRL